MEGPQLREAFGRLGVGDDAPQLAQGAAGWRRVHADDVWRRKELQQEVKELKQEAAAAKRAEAASILQQAAAAADAAG